MTAPHTLCRPCPLPSTFVLSQLSFSTDARGSSFLAIAQRASYIVDSPSKDGALEEKPLVWLVEHILLGWLLIRIPIN
ncbi:uncharacterized protein K460DRAFT_367024 [Cucurbitaria berberidis CBS 394.84]|uniref:Uncharacterized protein n=1 Tax=Cucurbitaria berberidis CBS 394.84 TaxID=1168544 RepID=A0A9P4GHG2_9PLEO|nr:uncharacterized protein K460DRAFT_367024 [Cucurbitaria berberidis CBS 394.84]KAF1846208.1 hypothetical protein K460DRAFT_367024 [Cucurbitaria berberidis CBS 394.84]